MIVALSRYTTRLAVRIRNLQDGGQLIKWQDIQLVIAPGQEDAGPCCGVMGSPWILCGCWPFHPTGVDVANPSPHDFPAITLDAFTTDDEGRIVFQLDKRFHDLPNGRYTGILRVHPHTPPINLVPPPRRQHKQHHRVIIPPGYGIGFGSQIYYDKCGEKPCEPPCFPPFPPVKCCVLSTFDIDLGPECAQHMVDQCALEFMRNDCGEER